MAIKAYKRGSGDKLTENFNVSEFLCKGSGCCTEGRIDEKLVEILQDIRDHFGKPVYISSAYRCPTWNKAVGGVSGSYHLSGQAADIKVADTAPAEVAKYAESIGVLGIGLYETDSDGYFVHVDTRTTKSYWYGQKQEYRATFGGAREDNATNETVNIALPVLAKGSEGYPVRVLQYLLIGNGHKLETYGADGDFGSETEDAVKKYQQDNGLTVDGIVGAKTWASLLGL